MSHYSVRDFGAGFSPWVLNSQGDVVGRQNSSAGSTWAVHFADNTVLALPAEISVVMGISDNGLVLGRRHGADVVLFDVASSAITPFSIPGFPYIYDVAIDGDGNLAGTAGQKNTATEMRGFLWERASQALTWIYPTNVPLPQGAAPFLELRDRNNFGHAAGVQGWVRETEQLEVPIYYDGYTVIPIGNYTFIANGIKITNNNRMRVWYSPNNAPESEAIYDGTTNTLTPFPNGRIIDLNATGQILWETPWPNATPYLTSTLGTSPLILTFPAGSGWSNVSATRMNDAGAIVGFGSLGDESHGYMLTPNSTFSPAIREDIVATILWGIINDAGGAEIIGGYLHRVPPRGPLRELLDALPEQLNSELRSAITQARLDNPVGAQTFSSHARAIVEGYRRQNRFG